MSEPERIDADRALLLLYRRLLGAILAHRDPREAICAAVAFMPVADRLRLAEDMGGDAAVRLIGSLPARY